VPPLPPTETLACTLTLAAGTEAVAPLEAPPLPPPPPIDWATTALLRWPVVVMSIAFLTSTALPLPPSPPDPPTLTVALTVTEPDAPPAALQASPPLPPPPPTD